MIPAADTSAIIPVILSGGSGSRLWPMSRPECPKQFLALTAAQTMVQLTALRTRDRSIFTDPIVVANTSHADRIADQLGRVGVPIKSLILEPAGRNTAPAIALAALAAPDPNTMILVMPSDHVIADDAAFQAAIAIARPLAEQGWLVTFGITAETPETGYGYIRTGDEISPGAYRVSRFVEKPGHALAKAMVAMGDHVWNGGIFLFRADAYLAALAAHAPDVLSTSTAAMDQAYHRDNRITPDATIFTSSPAISIDYAVMEKAAMVAVVPVSMGWSDLGSWDALHAMSASDENGNVLSGDVHIYDSNNCLVRSDGPRIAMIGVSDVIVVACGNDIVILPRGRSQEVRHMSNDFALIPNKAERG